MTRPADFANYLEGERRHDADVWLILCDLLADQGRDEDADKLRRCILSGQVPDQINGLDEYVIIVPGFRIHTIHVPRWKSRPRPHEID